MSGVVISQDLGEDVDGGIVLVLIPLRMALNAGACDQGRRSVVLARPILGVEGFCRSGEIQHGAWSGNVAEAASSLKIWLSTKSGIDRMVQPKHR